MIDMDVNSEKEFNKFYKKYSNPITRYIFKIIHDLDKSEDLAHDTFIRFFNNVDDYDIDSSRTRNYIYTIARNLAYDYIKKMKLEESRYMTAHFDEVQLTKSFYKDLDSSFIQGEVISTIHDTIDKFSGKKKTIAIERIFHNKNLRVLSEKFDMTSYNIKKIEEEAFNEIKFNLIQICPELEFEFDPDME